MIRRVGLFLVAALAVNAPRFIVIFLLAEGVQPSSPWLVVSGIISGIGNAILLVAGIAVAFDGWAMLRRKRNASATDNYLARILLALVVGLATMSIVMLAPWVYYSVGQTTLGQSMATWLRPIWSVIVVASVDLAICGAVLAQRVQVEQPQPAKVAVDGHEAQPEQKKESPPAPSVQAGNGNLSTREKIALYLTDHPTATNTEIGKAIGISRQAAAKHRHLLETLP